MKDEIVMGNVGSLDRILHFALGAVLLATFFVSPFTGYVARPEAWKFALAAVGLVLIATAAFRLCPACLLFGIRTCEIGKR